MRTEEGNEVVVLEPVFGIAGDYLLAEYHHQPLHTVTLRLEGDEHNVVIRLTGVELLSVEVQNFMFCYEFEAEHGGARPCIGRAKGSRMLRRLQSGKNFHGLDLNRLQHIFVLGDEALLEAVLTGDVEVVHST